VIRVRPLLGGIEAWRERGYPLEPVNTASPDSRAPITGQPIS
jgi:3-mercaptopyruvate sulfurtransferase SseA